MLFSTYLGGNGEDWAEDLAVDPAGNSYLVGRTSATNFPVTASAYQPASGGNADMFLSKIDPDGANAPVLHLPRRQWRRVGRGVAVDAAGVAYVSGITTSANFPVKNATQPAFGGSEDFAIAKFDTTQSGAASCVYATYFGGSGTEYNRNFEVGLRIAFDAAGATYFTDDTNSPNYPTTTGVIQPALGSPGNLNAVVTKLDAAGALVWSTFLGGTSAAQARGIAVDGAGSVYVTGYQAGSGFPTTAGAYHVCSPTADLWVSKLNPAATALDWSTCMGPGNAFRLALGEGGAVYVAGYTASSGFPMVNPSRARSSAGATPSSSS